MGFGKRGCEMLSRRDVVGRLATGAAAIVALGGARRAVAAVQPTTSPAHGESAVAGIDVIDGGQAPAAVESAPHAAAVVAERALPASGPPPWELLHPLSLGTVVAQSWRVSGLSPVEHGACVLTLQNGRGREHRIHLCRNDGRPQGLVYTRRVDLVVMNGGAGDLPTDEGLAQAVAEVAHVLAANEGEARHAPVMAALQPHAERVERFAAAAALR
jgi:hypothetical protein